MRSIYVMAIVAAVSATPAFAAEADPHATHHPQTTTTPAPAPRPEPKAATQTGMMAKCPMMQSGGSMNGMMQDNTSMSMGGGKAMNCPVMKTQPGPKSSGH